MNLAKHILASVPVRVEDGRVITEILDNNVLPSSLKAHSDTLEQLGQIYKEINAPFGQLSLNTLTVSTYAITSSSAGDAVYNSLEGQINDWTLERHGLAAQIKTMLEGAEFGGASIDEKVAKDIIIEGQALLDQAARACASNPALCAK